MASRSSPINAVCLVVLSLLAIPTAARFASLEASATPKPHGGSARTLHVRNSNWNRAKIEVRTGPNRTCDALGSLGIQVLERGQEWVVQYDDPAICWRTGQAPGDPSSSWDSWHQLNLADGETNVVTL